MNQNESVLAYNSLLGCPQSKSRLQVGYPFPLFLLPALAPQRLQVLFLRLRVHTRQYTEGLLSLTEFHKKNISTIKKIVHSQSIGLRSHSGTDLQGSPETMTNASMAELLSQADEEVIRPSPR
jgi:hypothetical protein